jgi:dihydropteroate synthase
MKLAWANFSFDFTQKTYVMGILNVTPDSFSDGGKFLEKSKAIKRAIQMVEDGADIIDIGGESTRPGSEPITIEEELQRTIPVITAVSKEIRQPVSIDTYKSEVAKRALDAGASLVNDISGLKFDPKMRNVIAHYEVPVILMHIKGTPNNMQQNPIYEALIPEILDYLRESVNIAESSGIPRDKILIDPGIGFGKTFEQNLEIIHNLKIFSFLEKPICIGPSRKAFIGKILETTSTDERLEGTAAAVSASILNGANIVRVHDVKEMVRVAKVADAIMRIKSSEG